MDKTESRLTVYFEAPFWVGIYERTEKGKLSAARVVFGTEPKDGEVYECFLTGWNRMKFSPSVKGKPFDEGPINPKRMQREVQSRLREPGIGTKAQQALKLQQEQAVQERKLRRRERNRAEEERKYERNRQKKKEKKRGR